MGFMIEIMEDEASLLPFAAFSMTSFRSRMVVGVQDTVALPFRMLLASFCHCIGSVGYLR